MQQTNPFTPRASLVRYWNTHVSNKLPIPQFLVSKASPLTPRDYAFFRKLVSHKTLSSRFESFCTLANLYCSFDDSSKDAIHRTNNDDANFALYSNKRFTNYGSSRVAGVDSFKNYSGGLNTVTDSFKKYSQASTRHSERFTNYAENTNVANTNFTSYGSKATAGSGNFNNYDKLVNVPNLGFASYDSGAVNRQMSFSSYGNETNSGGQSFTSYGKSARAGPTDFTNYAVSSNILQSDFTGYGESGGRVNNTFKSYGSSGNNPRSTFKTYGSGSNSGSDTFTSYRNGANVGQDSFENYAAKSNSGSASFENYGKSFNPGNDSFKGYGKGSVGRTIIGFKSYSVGRSFKDYNKQGVWFSQYSNLSASSGKMVNKWVEAGKFFRESMMKEGNVMVMPDIRDKMPSRSFLPGAISSKLPFSSSLVGEMKEVFHARRGSAMERVMIRALEECERSPSPGETKRCVGSGEAMIEFAVSVLGPNVVLRKTENVRGSRRRVMIGRVKAINGGKVTKSVSCHQSLYPYLLYYCHSVPKVRVYEADILDVDSKAKINHGVAICHLDTSAWGPEHGAFVALGSTPGKIEVCHWIFENDVTWTIGD
ncbi:polygalacturonase 1 beta-like protein 3 [Senna tora]|uniref:Polygalacturonase 1 beta-like protein 3 n=1 Tax=Senna tora TaxID=362788 RepID=A0A834SZ30_9FABA|nr:polygalacturonase 1 beta-like protein 3 [Senna tora]